MLRFVGFVLPICMAGIYNADGPNSKVLNLISDVMIKTACSAIALFSFVDKIYRNSQTLSCINNFKTYPDSLDVFFFF